MTHPNVLLVDDDDAVRDALRELLEAAGYRVAAARNGRHALDLLEAGESPAILVTDLRMPVMNGLELIATLRSIPGYRDLPIVVVSATPDGFIYDLRQVVIVRKPLVGDDLLAAVRRSLRTGPPAGL